MIVYEKLVRFGLGALPPNPYPPGVKTGGKG